MSRRFDDKDVERLVEMYNKGLSYNYIATALGFKERCIRNHADQLKKSGVLGKRKRPFGRVNSNSKRRTESDVIIATITDMYNRGITVANIAKTLHISEYRAYNCVNDLLQAGCLKRRYIPRPRKSKNIDIPLPTLKEGETIKCTPAVSRNCIYGTETPAKGMCNYLFIAGHSRSKGESGCPHGACTKYSQGKPRLKERVNV